MIRGLLAGRLLVGVLCALAGAASAGVQVEAQRSGVEVRLRGNGRFGGAAESITAAKQRRVLIAAQWWLGGAGRRFRDAPCRFDAVLLDALDPARVTWLPGAFDAG